MMVYYVVLIIMILLSIVNLKNKLFEYLVIFLLSIIASIRIDLGADYESYFSIFTNLNFKDIFSNEPLFITLIFLIKFFNLDFHFFLFITTLISLISICKAIKLFNVKNFWMSLLIYFCLFYFQFQFNVIRHGFMASLIWLGYSVLINYKYRKIGYLYILIGTLYQYLGFVFLLLSNFLRIRLNQFHTIIMILLSMVCYFFNLSDIVLLLFFKLPLLGSKISYYVLDYDSSGYGFTFGMFVNFMFFLILRFIFFKKEYFTNNNLRLFLNSLLFAFFISLFFNRYNIFVERMVSVLNVSLIFLIPYFYEKIVLKSKQYENRIIFNIVFMIYIFLIFNQILHTPMPNNKLIMQFTPYKTILCSFPF